MIGLVFGLDHKTWTVIDYPTSGQYAKWANTDHALDIIDYWTPLKVSE
jgi:hypothetical protein